MQCRRILPIQSYALHRVREGEYRNQRCNKCRGRRHYESKGVKEKRALILAAKSQPCADCGATCDPLGMQFDNTLGPHALRRIDSQWLYASMRKLKAELSRSDVVCGSCYRVRLAYRVRRSGRHPRAVYETQTLVLDESWTQPMASVEAPACKLEPAPAALAESPPSSSISGPSDPQPAE